eukprot:CAMPEP_0181296284 /NCGR_PEP_ID=MMETSP1101-20121128/4618_1 /TAXON_ID=46948 /ORGANISM="Rhodomonas abbreviata, Strain Caron Lab Isolate" /LENGTH=440 /DNA_ID=CAMNT_0023401131 /DNA_START=172 /DNA_END=1491 /DNA_ORIENTATION=+
MFKAGEEWLALPEVFSNLDFSADSTPASEEDVEGQIQLRATRFWGRLYIDGWPQTIQFFRAHFGIEPPLGRKTFVFAEPRDACEDLTNAEHLTAEHVLLVHRGSCTFGSKAKIAAKTNASGIIIINNEPGLDHLPGPDAHDIQFSVSSVAQSEGLLLEAVYDEGPMQPNGFGRPLQGYLVPINCENSGARCLPATYQERKETSHMIEGGTLEVRDKEGKSTLRAADVPLEYLLAHYGTMVPGALPLVVAKPAEACQPLENSAEVRGKAVLVRRGSCPFVKKAEEVQAAGGRVMLVGSLHPYILRMGVEPRWKGLNTMIPVAMVSKRAYSVLVAESYMGGSVSFTEDAESSPGADAEAKAAGQEASGPGRTNSATWEPLEKLAKGEGWPRSPAYVTKRYGELKEQLHGFPDRLATLEDAYARKMKEEGLDAHTEKQANKDE